jgi:uncharacterized protein (TIGR03435 family)
MIAIQSFANLGLRSSVLILSGILLLKALRVKDASVRLAAWTAMLCGSLALPLLTVSVPSLPVRMKPVPVQRTAAPAAVPTRATVVFEASAPSPKRFDWVRAALIAYLTVAGVLLLRLGLGLALALRLLQRSRPTGTDGVRESDGVASPVTLGVIRPRILLPIDWREWDATKLAAVLAHEHSHISRRDPAVQVLSAIHRALLWYSPLSWYLDRQIVQLAEQASDDAAVAAIRDRASYAEVLLEFMRRGVRGAAWQVVPMARYGQPEQRIHRILDSTTLSRGMTRWSIMAIVALTLPLAYVVAAAQARLTFDAASVKPAIAPPGVNINGSYMTASRIEDLGPIRSTGGPGTSDPGRIHYPLVSLKGLLERAYESVYFEIKAPDWAGTDILSVDATMPSGATKEQCQQMLRNLIVDRFQMKSHVETKEVGGYVLVAGKGGPKLKEFVEGGPPPIKDDGWPALRQPLTGIALQSMPYDHTRMIGHGTMADLAKMLTMLLNSRVEDASGLSGTYEIKVPFAGRFGGPRGAMAILDPAASTDAAAPETLPNIFAAVQAELGLKLEQKKVPVEILVVDHVEKTPSGN